MENLCHKMEEILVYIRPLLPLTNSHTVTFITENTWNKVVPNDIKLEVELLGVNEVLRRFWKNIDNSYCKCALSSFTEKAKIHTIEHTDIFLSLSELRIRLNKLITNDYKPIKLKEFMSAKKVHEVEFMNEIVSRIAAATNASHIIDIGSGKGYVSSLLVLQHRFKVLGIDYSHINTHGAAQRTIKLEKHWNVLKNRSENPEEFTNNKKYKVKKLLSKDDNKQHIEKSKCSTHEEYYNKYKWKSDILDTLYKQRTENITENTDLIKLIQEEYPNDYYDSLSIIGLHTCGDLSASCLKLFVNNSILKSVINVSCCYHLIEEEFIRKPEWQKTTSTSFPKFYGFPLSSYLRSKKFSLGRDARMCATQFPQKVFQERKLSESTKPLFYRALLQQFLVNKYGNDDFGQGVIGRLAHKCDTFSEYVHKALKRLDLNIQVEESELEKLQLDHIQDWEYLKIFFLLKTALSPVLESIILMDRVLYLHEMGIRDAFVTQLFDPLLSPRCYAVIGIKSNPTINLLE